MIDCVESADTRGAIFIIQEVWKESCGSELVKPGILFSLMLFLIPILVL